MSSYSETVFGHTRKKWLAIVEITAIFLYITITMGYCLAEYPEHLVRFTRWVPVVAQKLHDPVMQVFIMHDFHSDVIVTEETFNKGGKKQMCPKCNWTLVESEEAGQVVYRCPKNTTRLFGKDVMILAKADNPAYAEIFRTNPAYKSLNYEVWVPKNTPDSLLVYDKGLRQWSLNGANIEYDSAMKMWKLPGGGTLPAVDINGFKYDLRTMKWSYNNRPVVYDSGKGAWLIDTEWTEVARGTEYQPEPMPLENRFCGFLQEEPKILFADDKGRGKDNSHPDRSFVVKRSDNNEVIALTSDDASMESLQENNPGWVWSVVANMIVATGVFFGLWLAMGIVSYLLRKLLDPRTNLLDVLVYGGYAMTLLVPIWMLRYGAHIRMHSVEFFSFWHGSYAMPVRLGETGYRIAIGNLLLIPLFFCLVYVMRSKAGEKKLGFLPAAVLAVPYFMMACYFCI
ncbi:MAG: hypothetical protein HZA48_05610 [Planctomycetes bacterium]|nr:hypothetical protein [Planctomycetota bacterium]